MTKTREELINAYIEFFKLKKHNEIPNSPLIPANDPTVLFTTAGMHPLVPYLLGQKHPLGKRLVNVQRCLRTGDIEEVGDEVHHTFFEMLGNWSLGDYWKKEAIEYSFDFLTRVLKLPKEKLAVSCFKGDKDAEMDKESAEAWLSIGIPKERIAFLGKEDNWWGPAGETGPCGPDTEIFYWTDSTKTPRRFDAKDRRWVEIWNDVFMEYEKTAEGYRELKQKNVDTGMGVERTLAVLNAVDDNYKTNLFNSIIKKIEEISVREYESHKKEMRIVADHAKASVFIVSDGVSPGNVGQGYILRRLIRRGVRYGRLLGIERNFMTELALKVFEIYKDYENIRKNRNLILTKLDEEENKFRKTLEKGLREFEKVTGGKIIRGKEAFLLYQSYGFPIEMTQEMAKEKKIRVDVKSFNEEYKRHQELSRSTSSGVFKSGLSDSSEKTTRLHTATHLLNEALSRVLGDEVAQRGSNITAERTRFDFTFSRKLTDDEIKEVENLINNVIDKGLVVKREEMALEDAFSSGAKGEFGHKYPERVSVFTVVDESEDAGFFSREICTGPHVKNTKEIGKFKIVKQESVSAGVRRIKAVVE